MNERVVADAGSAGPQLGVWCAPTVQRLPLSDTAGGQVSGYEGSASGAFVRS